jgi:hypothetical protein
MQVDRIDDDPLLSPSHPRPIPFQNVYGRRLTQRECDRIVQLRRERNDRVPKIQNQLVDVEGSYAAWFPIVEELRRTSPDAGTVWAWNLSRTCKTMRAMIAPLLPTGREMAAIISRATETCVRCGDDDAEPHPLHDLRPFVCDVCRGEADEFRMVSASFAARTMHVHFRAVRALPRCVHVIAVAKPYNVYLVSDIVRLPRKKIVAVPPRKRAIAPDDMKILDEVEDSRVAKRRAAFEERARRSAVRRMWTLGKVGHWDERLCELVRGVIEKHLV